MSDETAPRDPADEQAAVPAVTAGSPETAAPAQRPAWRQPALWLALLALVAAAIALLESRSRLSEMQQEVARRLAASETAGNEGRALARQNQNLLLALQGKIGALEARFGEFQGQQVALEAMYQELVRHRDDSLVAEAEHAVTLAVQQLKLAGNVEAALIALQDTEARLARSEDPSLAPLRTALARDIDRLRAAAPAYSADTASRLEAILASIDVMPLAFEAQPRAQASRAAGPAAPAGFWTSLAADLWSELRALIRIERTDRPQPALLAPEHAFFLRENVKLRLIDARIAALQRDPGTLRDDLRQAHAWIARYFDPDAAVTRNALDTLARLASIEPVEPPSLSETLSALRSLQAARGPATTP